MTTPEKKDESVYESFLEAEFRIHEERYERIDADFGEDLDNDIGIWKSLEYYNNELFDTPLPLVVNEDDIEDISGISPSRAQFLLWNHIL